MTRLLVGVFALGCILCAGLGFRSAHAQAPELGIDRSGLGNWDIAYKTKALEQIHALHARWFRDGVDGATPDQVAKSVELVRLVNQNGLKMLAIIGPSYKDFDPGYKNPNAGQDFQSRCGWPQGSGELSKVNLTTFSQHLHSVLGAVKGANLTIDAFEIGNEYDWICFNGDVPNGHTASAAEIKTLLSGYGEFLKTAAIAIRKYFPNAKIITFGIAHSDDRYDKPAHHISHPAATIIAGLRHVNGFNYLDNSLYHVDGYGAHIYPWSGDVASSVRSTLGEDASALTDKPLWVTEWGFLSHSAFPNKKGQTLDQGVQEMLDAFVSISSSTRLGPVMFYSYSGWLADPKTQEILPLANVVSAYGAKH